MDKFVVCAANKDPVVGRRWHLRLDTYKGIDTDLDNMFKNLNWGIQIACKEGADPLPDNIITNKYAKVQADIESQNEHYHIALIHSFDGKKFDNKEMSRILKEHFPSVGSGNGSFAFMEWKDTHIDTIKLYQYICKGIGWDWEQESNRPVIVNNNANECVKTHHQNYWRINRQLKSDKGGFADSIISKCIGNIVNTRCSNVTIDRCSEEVTKASKGKLHTNLNIQCVSAVYFHFNPEGAVEFWQRKSRNFFLD